MIIDNTVLLEHFAALVGDYTVRFDGVSLIVGRADKRALSPAQAAMLLESTSHTLKREAFTGEAVAADAPPVEPAPEPRTTAGKKPGKDFPTITEEDAEAFAEAEAETADLKEPVEPKPKAKGRRKRRSVADDVTEEPPAEDAGGDEPPAAFVEAKQVKVIVAALLEEGLDPDGVWERLAPWADKIPSVARLRNPESRVKRVAAAFYEG